MTPLRVLDERIGARVAQIVAEHPDWPCRRGCDACCRSLSQLPRVTAPEWDRLRDAVGRLLPAAAAEVAERLRTAGPEERVCPFLDRQSGECLVYDSRPIACRTYGFYADREAGLYCNDIVVRVNAGEFRDVVWGNQEAIDVVLDGHGQRRTITEWAQQSTP